MAEVLHSGWLEEMLGWCSLPGVGAVGARLWRKNGTLRHGGVLLGVRAGAGHAHHGWLRGESGDHGRAILAQDFSACSGACLLLRRKAYEAVGGLDALAFPGQLADVDLCLKLRAAGQRVVWTPSAELLLHDSPPAQGVIEPRDVPADAPEWRLLRRRWARWLDADPAYNPNLTRLDEGFQLNEFPRTWQPPAPASANR
jgi:O-antigen biosynthesis protein